MKQFDFEKLEKAIIYVDRMADGRIPYSNRPSDNEILNDPNTIRCMYFIKEVLQEVKANGGIVGGQKARRRAAIDFPYEVLEHFTYQEDLPVSYVLRQFAELTGNPKHPIITAAEVNKWLAANGYLTKARVNAEGREDWVPTNEGKAIGITSEERGEPGREYIRIIYTKPAQEFLAENLKVITEQQLNG